MLPLSSLAPEDPNQYEDISKYSEVLEKLSTGAESSTGEFSITTCSVYMPTTRSAQLETDNEVSAPVGPDELGEGPPQGQGSAIPLPEYEVMVNMQDQKSEASSEYEVVKTGETN